MVVEHKNEQRRDRIKSPGSEHWTAFSSQILTVSSPTKLTPSSEKFSTTSSKSDNAKKTNRKNQKIKQDKEGEEEEEEENDVESDSWSTSSSTTDHDIEIPEKLSPLSLSSTNLSTISQQQIPIIITDSQTLIELHEELFDLFRDAMKSLTVQTSTTQQRIFVNYLLNNQFENIYSSPETPKETLKFKSSTVPSSSKQTPVLSLNRVATTVLSSSLTPPTTISSMLNERQLIYLHDFESNLDIIRKRIQFNNQRFNKIQSDTIRLLTSKAMEITQDVINLQNHERKKFIEHIRLTQSLELRIKHLWHNLSGQLTHELSIWYEPQLYPQFWELDPTETPNRERRRLQRAYCLMNKKYFQSHVVTEKLMKPTLWYLFDSSMGSINTSPSSAHQSMAIQTILYRNEKIEYQCRCINVTPSTEIKGELLIGIQRIYFVADDQTTATTKSSSIPYQTTYFYNYFSDDFNSFSFCFDQIREIYKRRYMLKDIALELFLTNGITLLLAQTNQHEREHLYKLLLKKNLINYIHGETLNDVQLLWRQGLITNFDYIMSLNKLAGRTFNDLMQYPICPYIISTYDKDILDLHMTQNYRDLTKPIAIQHKEKEEKFIDMYKALKESHELSLADNVDISTASTRRSFGPQSDPYHFASLYSNSGIVLHYLVRLLPYTKMFLDYQDQNFDCPDRTFHDIKTSWWLSSYESTSDFKELIPEFYFLHEFLLNKQQFNFGIKQNGQKVNDVCLPAWAKKNHRLFVNILRQALESDYVTQHIHQWIDLVFGFKQTGKAALDAINVFHAACYYGYPIDTVGDEVTRKAHQGIIRTCGQVPKQLFPQQHPSIISTSTVHSSNGTVSSVPKRSERGIFEQTLPIDSIHRHALGVKWGDFVGSYDQPSPEYVSKHECPIPVVQFICLSNGNEIICLPPYTSLFYQQNQEARIRSASTVNTTVSDTSLSNDPMIVLKWNTSDSVVRCRQLRQQKQWYNFYISHSSDSDYDKITSCASVDYCLLFMGKKSGLIEVFKVKRTKTLSPCGIELVRRYLPFIAHRSPITCLHVNKQFSLLLSTSADGMLILWDTNRLSYVRQFKHDDNPIYCISASETTCDICYLCSNGASEWYLFYLTCNCDLIGSLTFSEQINCICFTNAPEGQAINMIIGGFETGKIQMWSTWDLTLLRQLDFHQLKSCPIVAITVSKIDRRRLYISDRNKQLHVIETNGQINSQINTNRSTLLKVAQPPQVLFLT
ncbi:unnamed protein product [Didymodactylos carnosus]|uniref:Uncharacterized protein n=1 Tax=Didymodactylos carnosus TaxID=1234261 RepID=A0A815AR36_9BILA|nr:unnamed protein product [Didymodactylos carnosus]CAF4036933.1 unnamed protein product [Didymodactylos carnosus]